MRKYLPMHENGQRFFLDDIRFKPFYNINNQNQNN